MILPYGIQTYRRADLPRVRLINQFAEKVPTSRVQIALLPRPALSVYSDIGAGPIRGIFSQPGALSGALFSVSGTELYNGDSAIGVVAGTARVSMAATLNRLMIANDTGLYSSDGATVTPVAFPNLPVPHADGASSIGYINGYTFASHTDTRRLYFTLDPDVWDDNDYISAETSTGNIVAALVVSDQIWAFCERVTEVFVTTGNSVTPFQRVEGRLYDKGCLARDTIVKMDNSVVWVGHDFIVYRGDSAPVRISDHGIEERIQSSNIEDLRAWAFPWLGHVFYVLTTSSGTVVYDAATQQWTEFASYQREQWRAHIGVFHEGFVVAGDDEAGRLWVLDGSLFLDGDDPIERIHTAIEEKPGFCDNMVLDCSAGEEPVLSTEPLVEIRTSRDQGNTWGTWRPAGIGQQGQYRKRAAWRRLGMIDGDGMVFEHRLTDATPWRVSSQRMNEGLGGRGRPG